MLWFLSKTRILNVNKKFMIGMNRHAVDINTQYQRIMYVMETQPIENGGGTGLSTMHNNSTFVLIHLKTLAGQYSISIAYALNPRLASRRDFTDAIAIKRVASAIKQAQRKSELVILEKNATNLKRQVSVAEFVSKITELNAKYGFLLTRSIIPRHHLF